MNRSICVYGILSALLAGLATGCGSGSNTGPVGAGSSEDAYEYVSEWELPEGTPIGGLYLAADWQTVLVSVYEPGGSAVHLYDADGTYVKDLVTEMAQRSPPVLVASTTGVALSGSHVFLVDYGNERVLRAHPTDTVDGGLVEVDYHRNNGMRCALGVAVSGNQIYTAGHDGDLSRKALDQLDVFQQGAVGTHTFSEESDPQAVAVGPGPDRYLYVVDRALARVYKLSSALDDVVKEWGSPGSGPGQFRDPLAIAVGSDGTVFVLDTGNSRVQFFDPEGSYLGEFGTSGKGPGQFQTALGIAVSSDGYVYVGDTQPLETPVVTRIQKFRRR